MAITLVENPEVSGNAGALPEFKPENFKDDPSFEADLLAPALKVEKEERQEVNAWRGEMRKKADEHLLNFDKFEPGLSEEIRKRSIIRAVMDSELDLNPKSSSTYPLARKEAARKLFDGQGGENDEAFFGKLQERATVTKEDNEFYGKLERQSTLSALLGGTELADEFSKEIENDPALKRDRYQAQSRWREVSADVYEQYDGLLPQIRDVFGKMKSGGAWVGEAAMMSKDLDDEEKEKFLLALRDLATTYPTPEIEAGFARLGLNIKKTGRGVIGAVQGSFDSAGDDFRDGGTFSLAELFGSNEEVEKAKKKQDEDAEWARQVRQEHDFVADVRTIFEQDYDPIRPLAKDDTFLRAVEDGAYAMPGAITTTAMAAIPVMGWGLTYSAIKESERQKYRGEILAAGGSREDAANLSGELSTISAIPQMFLEKVQAMIGVRGKIPALDRIMGRADVLIANRIGRGAVKFGIAGVAETAVELTQDMTSDLVQDIANAFGEEIPGIEWKNGVDGHFDGYFNKTVTTFVAVAPLGILSSIGGLSNEKRAAAFKVTPRELRTAWGFSKEANDAIDNATTPTQQVIAMDAAQKTRDPNSPEAREANEAIKNRAASEEKTTREVEEFGVSPAARKSPDKDGFEVYDVQTGETIVEVDTAQDATEVIFGALNVKVKERKNDFQSLLSKLEAAELDVAESGEMVEVEVRSLTESEAAELMPGTDTRIKLELELIEQRNGGTGEVTREVMGESRENTVAGAYISAGQYGRKEAVTKLWGGSSILTLIHERGHGKRKALIASGAWTLEDQVSSIKGLDALITEEGERFLPADFETRDAYGQEVAIDEAVAELAEVLALNSRKGARSKMGSLISKNLRAMVAARIPGAAQLEAFVTAMREYFGLQLRRAVVLKKAVRDGKLDQAQIEQLTDMLVGQDPQEAFEAERDRIPSPMIDGKQTPSYSISNEASSTEEEIKKWKETDDSEKISGAPGPDTASETIEEDEDGEDIPWEKGDTALSVRSLPEAFPYMNKELADEVIGDTDTVGMIDIDRLKVGEFEGVDLQGGMFYPTILENLKARIAWAFNSAGVATSVLTRARENGGYIKLVLMAKGNVIGNKTFANIWFNRLEKSIEKNPELESQFIAEFQKSRAAAVISKVKGQRRKENKEAEKNNTKPTRRPELEIATYHRSGEGISTFAEAKEFMIDMGQIDRGNLYFGKSVQGKDTANRKKGETIYGRLLSQEKVTKMGFPDAKDIVSAIEEPAFEGMKTGSVVGLIKIDLDQEPMTAQEAGVTPHISYGYVLKGEPVARFRKIRNIEQDFKQLKYPMQRAGFKYPVKETALAGPSFSIASAGQIETWAKSKSASETRRMLKSMKLTPTKEMVSMLGKFPKYLEPVVDFIIEQREKLASGSLTNRDVAKAYWMTISSIGADSIDIETVERQAGKIGVSFNPEPLFLSKGKKGQDQIRPEELAAWWLGTESGQRALDSIEEGVIDAEAWEEGMALRDAFGRQDFRTVKKGTPYINKKGENKLSNYRAGGLGALNDAKDFNLSNVSELTQAINETRGDIKKLEPILLRIKGIAEGKKGFIGHMLGVGDFATIDAVELNVWLTGESSTTYLSEAKKKRVALAKAKSGTKSVSGDFFGRIQKRIKGLRAKADGGLKIPEELSSHIIHHWIWDAAKGIETSHKGLYQAMTSFSVSPAQDADYLSTVESGDMDKAQEMVDEAAKAAGYGKRHRQRNPDFKNKKENAQFVNGEEIHDSYGDHQFVTKGLAEIPEWLYEMSEEHFGDRDQVNPVDIVDAALAWDDLDFVSEVWLEMENRGLDGEVVGFETEDGGVVIDPWSAVENGIVKSADPVTYDSSGNVIPLSQRFNEKDDRISFSMADSRLLDNLVDDAKARVRSPEARASIFTGITSRVAKLKQSLSDLNREPDERSRDKRDELTAVQMELDALDQAYEFDLEQLSKEFETNKSDIGEGIVEQFNHRIEAATGAAATALTREAKVREAERMKAARQKFTGAKKLARSKIQTEKARLETAKKAIENALDGMSSREQVEKIRGSLVIFDSILKALPPELRGKVGGFVKLSKLNSDKKRIEYLEDRLEKLDNVVETWIQGEHRKQIKKLFKTAKPKKTGKGVPKSILAASQTDRVLEIEALSKLPRKVVDNRLDEILDEMDTSTDQAEIDKLSKERVELMAFGGIDGMNADALNSFFLNLSSVVKTGKMLKEFADEEFRAEADALKGIVNHDVTGGSGPMLSSESKRKAKDREGAILPLKWLGAEDIKIRGMSFFHRQNISFEWLMNNLARANKSAGTLASNTHKVIARMVHVATHQEKRANAAMQKRYQKILSSVFGGLKGLKLTKKIGTLMEEIEQTGVLRIDYGGKGAFSKKKAKASNIKAILEGADAEALGFNQEEWKSAKARYDEIKKELEDRAEASFQKNLEKEAEAAAAAKKEGKNRKDRKITREPVTIDGNRNIDYESPNVGSPDVLTLSQAQAINLSMLFRQKGLKESMIHEGYTEETMEQMEGFLSPDSIKIRDWLTQEYADNYNVINDVFKIQNGVSLPQTEFYSPARRLAQGKQEDLSLDSAGNSAMSTTPNFTISRTTNFAEVDQTANALSIYMQHMVQTNHYVTWAKPIKLLRTVFGDAQVKKNIKDYAGDSLLEAITERVEWFADGGNRKASHIKWLDEMRAAHTYSSLAFNWRIGLKQLTSLPAYAFDMTFADFGKYAAKFAMNPVDNFMQMLDTDYVKTRFKEGYERDVIDGLKQDGGLVRKALQIGMMGGKIGDIIPVIIGGWMARQRSYDASIKAGLGEAEAQQKAEVDFEMITDRAQQAGDLKDLSTFQGGGSIFKLFTMYKTSPRQYYANVYESLLDAKAGKKGSTKEFGRRLMIGQIVLPLTFQFVSDLLRGSAGDDETFEPEDYFRAMILGPLNGLFIAGDFAELIVSGVADSEVYAETVPILDGGLKIAYGIKDFWDGDWGEGVDTVLRGIGRTTPSMLTLYGIIRKEMERSGFGK